MFNFMDMAGNYEDRKVDKYEEGELFISTARVTDADKPYETAVKHPDYGMDGSLAIVETYDTIEEAQKGHDQWVAKMTGENLPDELADVGLSGIGQLANMFAPIIFERGASES
jgi:hypothetical protein